MEEQSTTNPEPAQDSPPPAPVQTEFDERLTPEEIESRRQLVVEVCRNIYDPEIPINIYDLGLVYEINVASTGVVHIVMTLTSPNCPEAEVLPSSVQLHVRSALRIKRVDLDVVWDPPWSWERMSEAARLEFGF